jgi:hypothetical protein
MGFRPTGRDEIYMRRHPRESGGPLLLRRTMDSRFRGNEVIFESDARNLGLNPSASADSGRQSEIPHSARNDMAFARTGQAISLLAAGPCRSQLEMSDSLAFR